MDNKYDKVHKDELAGSVDRMHAILSKLIRTQGSCVKGTTITEIISEAKDVVDSYEKMVKRANSQGDDKSKSRDWI